MKILIFGATGSAGGSVLRACLALPSVTQVRTVTRRPLALTGDNLQSFVHQDFCDYTGAETAFAGVDACFFCLGISVTQVSGEEEYRRITHDFALAAARMLRQQSPGASFHYISGQGTNSNSRFMWARVKAETERELMELCDAVCWRPAFIDGEVSDRAPWMYRVSKPLFRLLRPFRALYVAGEDLGRAMLRAAAMNYRRRILENAEIRELSARADH